MTTWLSLKKAADRLDVHPTTLRRWADQGDMPFMLTPGGHRRFSTEDIEAFQARRHGLTLSKPMPQMWSEQALMRTRRELSTADAPPWLSRLDDDQKSAHRRLGRQLMGLTLQYLSNENDEASFLAEARTIGRLYGRMGQKHEMPLSGALQLLMFFRDTLLETALELPLANRIKTEANVNLVRRLNRLLNEVQLAIAEVYEDGAGS